MGSKKRIKPLSPGFWKRAVAAYGVRGLPRAALRYLRARSNGREPAGGEFVDLTIRTADPFEAIRLTSGSGGRATPVIRVRIADLRDQWLGVRVDDAGSNPFTRTAAEHLSGRSTTYEESHLWRYYQTWQPANLAEFVGLEVTDDRSDLAQPFLAGVLPWEDGADRAELSARRQAHETSRIVQFGPSPSGTHGYTFCGPTSDTYGKYRFDKYCGVASNIARKAAADGTSGDRWWGPEEGGYVEMQILADGESWAGVVREGKHRSVALGAIGVEDLLVSIPAHYPVVRREEAASWPAVQDGLYTVDEALQVFDRFLEGAPPNGFPSWLTTASDDIL